MRRDGGATVRRPVGAFSLNVMHGDQPWFLIGVGLAKHGAIQNVWSDDQG